MAEIRDRFIEFAYKICSIFSNRLPTNRLSLNRTTKTKVCCVKSNQNLSSNDDIFNDKLYRFRRRVNSSMQAGEKTRKFMCIKTAGFFSGTWDLLSCNRYAFCLVFMAQT